MIWLIVAVKLWQEKNGIWRGIIRIAQKAVASLAPAQQLWDAAIISDSTFLCYYSTHYEHFNTAAVSLCSILCNTYMPHQISDS